MVDETAEDGTAQEIGTAQDSEESTLEVVVPKKSPAIAPTDFEKELQRVRTETGRRAAEAERKAEALAREVRDLKMRDMTEIERLQFERDEAINYANGAYSQLTASEQAANDARERFQRISELSRKTNVPFEELDKAQSPDDMAMIVHEWNQSLSAKQIEAEVEKTVERKAANKTIVGGGVPSTTNTRYDQALDAAFKAGDAVLYTRLLREGPK